MILEEYCLEDYDWNNTIQKQIVLVVVVVVVAGVW